MSAVPLIFNCEPFPEKSLRVWSSVKAILLIFNRFAVISDIKEKKLPESSSASI
jgi:hypothetical protein